MSTPIIYGQTPAEKAAMESSIARDIVKEIGTFGVNDRQRWLIIYFLAHELENHDHMREIIGLVRDLKGEELFVGKVENSDGS
jgi:hypothetical protein